MNGGFLLATIWCAIRTYAAHAEEMNESSLTVPQFFLKPEAALLSSPLDDPQTIDIADGKTIQHEVELVLRLGRDVEQGEDVEKLASAVDAVCVGIDLTDRPAQSQLKVKGLPWARSKAFRSSAIIGDWHELKEGDIHNIQQGWALELKVNERSRMKAGVAEMTCKPLDLWAALNEWAPLRKSDLIFTGTPAGVDWLKGGDVAVARLNDADGCLKSCLTVDFIIPSELK
jgi:2-keto-4-pentenoate hydratase/2-oxohepta-3-ene-1,7-dioic acid hydratase in catechol pathway